ncbi:hypothetical protein AB0B30_34745 [Streptomyces narbonensis]|uniref:Uncharacterized protein n=1 Tax=Streptomyces narbonensis TaxID=67333 RepID=A0ABV3CBY9_9ACTN
MIQALAVLSAESADQLSWIDEHKVATDELALEFDDVFRMMTDVQQEDFLDAEALGKLQLIDAMLEEMSGGEHADRWSREALATDAGWRQVRTLARDLLVRLQGAWRLPLPEIHVVR